jgi:hypothetical protein
MPLYPFGPNDIFRNQAKTYPKVDFWIWNRKIFYNNRGVDAGAIHSQSLHVEPGYISLYELNVDRDQNASGQMIYPYITKESGISAFKTVSTSGFNAGYLYGEKISGEYPLSATIQIEDWKDTALAHDIKTDLSVGRPHILALQTTFNSYKPLSQHYAYSSSLGHKGQQDLALVSIPSIFFGSSIRKGSVSLKFYISGTLAGELQDLNKNGELIQVSGAANSTNLLSITEALDNVTVTDLGVNTSEATKTFQIDATNVPDAGQEITIVSYDGTSKVYTAQSTENLTLRYFQKTPRTAMINSLKACIENANGHGTRLNVALVGTSAAPTGLTISEQATGEGSVAGVVLYNEGFIALTGSWSLDPVHLEDYDADGGADNSPKWIYFGTSANPFPGGGPSYGGTTREAPTVQSVKNSAWQLSFEGVNYIPALTMFAHAPKGWLNHSNNPTFKEHGQSTHTDVALSNYFQYNEPDNVVIKNTVSSSWEVLTASYNTDYQENSASFKRQTFISKIGIYDEQRNLIAVAKLARPVKKTEEDDFTFKLKLDF